MISAITGSIVAVLLMGVVPCYTMMKGVDCVYKKMYGKEKSITTIKLKDWSVNK